ncbi:MAG: S-layer homology domain-containing protein, partial [Eubacteriaceae bacterium]
LNYFYYKDGAKGSQNLSEEECRTIAEKYFKDKKPEKYAKSTLFSFNIKEQPDFYEFYYLREENGIICEGNYAKIMVSSHNGQIYSYECSWDNNATFPQVDGVMTESQLLDKIDAQFNYNLEYRQVGSENEIRLVYGFIKDTTESFDPYTGQELSYKGDPYEQDFLPNYTDIKGSYCEYAVTKLLENGYYLESSDSTKFRPKEKISQRSFFGYLYSQYYNSVDNEEFYNMLIEDGIITKEEIAPDKILTRQEAAKYIIKYLDLDLAGKSPDIYKVTFKDSIDEKYKGYAALANALGIIKGDTKGRFNGTGQMTNGEAAVVIYRLLTVKYGS